MCIRDRRSSVYRAGLGALRRERPPQALDDLIVELEDGVGVDDDLRDDRLARTFAPLGAAVEGLLAPAAIDEVREGPDEDVAVRVADRSPHPDDVDAVLPQQ